MNIFIGIIIFIFGLAIGSFLNVCIYRIPLRKSIIFPASHCPKCGNKIRAFDNIPVLSYLILKGKCRYCKEKISFIYPVVELLSGLLFLSLYL
ncbi:MAG TPA: prepilin peptidase, partial [candidate division Zixibacteria bacterium]